MGSIQNFYTSRDNNATANTYVGQLDRLWYDPLTNAIYVSDGNTPGGILVGSGISGNSVPGGPTNAIQYNAGNGQFGGTSSVVVSGTGITVAGTTTSSYFVGDGSQLTNLPGDIGNLYVIDQTIHGHDVNGNIDLAPDGFGIVNLPALSFTSTGAVLTPYTSVGGANPGIVFSTPANFDIELSPGTNANILTAGNVLPTGNNIAGLGEAGHRYTGLWLGAGNINIIDQGIGSNQEIYALDGNMIFAGGNGLSFGDFTIYDDTIATINPTANILIGLLSDSGYVELNRPVTVNSTGGVGIAFQVDRSGKTIINVPGNIAGTEAALNIIGSSSGNQQARNFTGTLLQATGQDNQPARVSFDAFGANGAQNSYVAIAGRAARGTVDSPAPLQKDDLMTRITSQGWTGNGYAASIARLNFAAAEAFTSNVSVGTYANIQLTPVGSNVIKTVTGFNAYGINFPNVSTGGTANLGIIFQDGSFQNTAYSPTTVVSSVTAGAGIYVSPTNTSATGNITITNYGVTTVAGTTNQVYVNGLTTAANGAVTLTLPQDIAPSSSPSFNTLTVANLVITGNVSNVIPSVVSGKVVYVANNASQWSDINNSGLITGNVANGYWAGMLYQTTGAYANTWDMTIGNSIGTYTGNLFANVANISGGVEIGSQYADPNVAYVNALLQGDARQDNYVQYVLQNHYRGANASADFVAVANNGDDGDFYIDMGINSNIYNNSDYAATGPNDGYLYVNGGNLVIGTQTPTKAIRFITGGTNSSTTYNRATITDAGLSVTGNIVGNNISAVNVTSGSTVSAVGNVIGSYLLAQNQVSAQGNVIGQNLNTTGVVSVTGNVISGGVRTSNITATGNITAGNLVTASSVIDGGVSTSGNVTGANIITGGSVSALGNIFTPNLNASIAIVSTLLSITGNINGGNLLTTGLLSTTGNVAAGNLNTAGRAVITGNIDAGNLRTAGTVLGTTVSATGNITGSYILGNGSQLTGLNAFGVVNANGVAISANNGSDTFSITNGNNLIILGNASAKTVNIAVSDAPTFTGNVTGGNIKTAGIVSAAGNVTGSYILGNGSALSSITGGNVTGTVANATYAASSGTAATVTTNAQPNITSVGTLTSVSVTGNVNSGNLLSSGLISTTGNISTGGLISATGNITGGNILTTGQVSATGNITAGNVNSTFHGNLIGSASNITTNSTGTAGTFLMGQVNVPAQTIPKNTTSYDFTVTITGLTTSHKVIVTPAGDLNTGVWLTAAYPTTANTLGIQFQNTNGPGITTSAFNLTYIAWV